MPRSTKDLLLEAYDTGHAWNPKLPNLQNLDRSRVSKMTGKEKDAKDLLRSRQSSDINFDILMSSFHKRFPIPDSDDLYGNGDDGPALQQLVDMPRCPIPDHPPPPGASFHYPDPGLNAAVESYQLYAATGRGSWPVGCDPNFKSVHSVVVAINTSGASTYQKSVMDEILRYVEETEAEMGQHVRHIRDGSYLNPQHSVKFEFIAGGVIGYAYFPKPDTCNQTVTARIDNSFDAKPFVLAELLTHEYKGHSDGLEHSRGGIMNPSIGSPTKRASWRGDPHERTKVGFFGGEPLVPGPGPGPGPTPARKVYLRANTAGSIIDVVAVQDFTAKKDEVLDRFELRPFRV